MDAPTTTNEDVRKFHRSKVVREIYTLPSLGKGAVLSRYPVIEREGDG